MLRYRRLESDTKLGFKGHTDKSFVSILHQNHVNGLEVRLNDGQWVCYQPTSPASFLVLAGDAIMGWSNDRIKSCYHRVMVSGEEVRYAMGLFSFMSGTIEAPQELVDEEHPLKYKAFYHQGLLEYYMKNNTNNKGETNMLKAYCGV
ncbi:Probable 2-oxoglutarate-dependent dioxygenase AOP1 (Fragment) [Linum perenne]